MLSRLKSYFKMLQSLLSIDFVADTPKFIFRINEVNNTFTFETVSLVPANCTWMSCSSSNDRYAHCQFGSKCAEVHTRRDSDILSSPCSFSHSTCETDSSWNEIPDASRTDSDAFCNKTIESSLSRDLVNGHHLRFCLTNSVGSWCETKFSIHRPHLLRPLRGSEIGFTLQNHQMKLCLLMTVI